MARHDRRRNRNHSPNRAEATSSDQNQRYRRTQRPSRSDRQDDYGNSRASMRQDYFQDQEMYPDNESELRYSDSLPVRFSNLEAPVPYEPVSRFTSTPFDSPNREEASREETRLAEEDNRGRGPKTYRRSDERILEDVCESLQDDHIVDASDIEVNVEEGVVTLSGQVKDRETKREAEFCVEFLKGVKDVRNNITIREHSKKDEEQDKGRFRGTAAS